MAKKWMAKKWLVVSLIAIVVFSLLGALTPILAENVSTQNEVIAPKVDPIPANPPLIFGDQSRDPGVDLYNMFLSINGIDGESMVEGYSGWIDVLSFNWGLSGPGRSGSGMGGSGSASGRTQVEDFSFSHLLDKASPLLMLACAKGTHIKDATFQLSHPNGNDEPFYELKMTDVMVSSVNLSGGSTVQPLATVTVNTNKPVESVSLNFAKIQWTYWTPNADGNPANPISGSYDLVRGR